MSDEISKSLQTIFKSYSISIVDKVNTLTDETAKDLKKELAQTSPVGYRGKLKKSWRLKKEMIGGIDEKVTVHSTEYQIVHLVENGHVTRDGKSRSRAYHFVKKAVDKIIPEYEKAVEEAVKNAE